MISKRPKNDQSVIQYIIYIFIMYMPLLSVRRFEFAQDKSKNYVPQGLKM